MADIHISLDIETATTIIAYLHEMAQDKWLRAKDAIECGGPSQANQIMNEFRAVHDCARALDTAVNVAAEGSRGIMVPEKLDKLETKIDDLNARVNWLERALHDDRT